MTQSLEKISGYDLANHLLSQGGVEALIQYAGNAETDWLELKAGMSLLPEPEDKKGKKKDETEKDLYWNIAKEVIALMNTSGGALVIGVHDETLNLVPLEDNDPRHIIAGKGIDGYIRDFVRANVWPGNLKWSDHGRHWELVDKQFPADLISYHHPSYTGPDGRSGEVVVLLVRPVEKIRLARKEQTFFALFKRTRGEVGEAQPIYDPEVIDEYKAAREIASERYANIRDQFDGDQAATSEYAMIAAAIKGYYNGLVEKSRRMRAVFTSLDAEENVFSKDDVDQFYSPEAIETFDDEDRWLDDDDENEERDNNSQEEDGDSDFEEASDEDALDNDDDAEDRYDERTARKGDLLELLKSEQRVIVSGEPGGGKTTCLTYFTLKFAEGEGEDPVLAVFIPMGQWRRGGSLSLMIERAAGLDASQIALLMKEGRLRLVIDAVNECPDEFRVAAIQNIGMFLAEHPNVPAVISTRHPKELSSLQLPVFHVQPMDEAHRLHYLERYLADGEQAQKLLRQLAGMPGGETVAENPMLLRLVVEVYKESPEKRLPNGRAGLYRRSLRAWYKRENEKAEKAGTKLQWNRRQTFELLAVLAFKSRQRGYRDVPCEEVSAIWGDDAENQLEVLCQGPIIYSDEEFVRFRHETFQEYLCAEYLIAHQDELPAWTQDDYAQWGMPFAYAVELFELDKQQLPEPFWLSAWSLNPWLGVALTDESKGRQLLNPRYLGKRPLVDHLPLDRNSRSPYLRAICGTFDAWTLRHALREDDVPWYKHGDVALRYVVFVSQTCQSRWKRFEDRQLLCLKGLWIKQAAKLSKNWLMLNEVRDIFQYHVPEDWDGWVANATPGKAIALVEARIAVPSDFSDVKAKWIVDMKLTQCCRLIKANIFQPSEFCEKIPQWVATASIEDAAYMIEVGLVSRSTFGERIYEWCKSATPALLKKMIKLGLVTREEIEECKLRAKRLILERIENEVKEGKLSTGRVVRGKVKDIVDLGAHIDIVGFDGVDGFLRFTNMSWGRIKHPDEFLKVGQEVDLKVLGVDMEEARVSLGLKQLTEDPWKTILQRFPIGKLVLGKVKNLAAYGAFVEIAPGIEGLVHISEFSWSKRIRVRPSDMLSVGDEITVQILSVDANNQKIALSIRQTQQNPWDTVKDRYPVGRRVKGEVCKFMNYGAFVEFEDGLDGMIHVSDMSWTRKINHPSECLKIGDEVEVIVLSVDSEKHRIGIGLKQAQENPWPDVIARYSIGMIVEGNISRISALWAFVELESGVDGVMHVSEMSGNQVAEAKNIFDVGDKVMARVIGIDRVACRILLSMKALSITEEECKVLYAGKESLPQEDVLDKKVVGDIHE